MNTKILMILENLSYSFGMGKRILKDWKDVHMGVKVLKVILLRR